MLAPLRRQPQQPAQQQALLQPVEETRRKAADSAASGAQGADEPPDAVPQEPDDNLTPQCPEGLVFIPGAGCREPPTGPGDEVAEGEEEPTQCPEGLVFSIKAGECVSEGPQQIVPQEETEQPTQCPEGLVFSIKAGECVSEGPQQIVPQEETEQPTQCPEGAIFNPEIDACSFPLLPADEGDEQGEPQAEQCPNGSVLEAGGCVPLKEEEGLLGNENGNEQQQQEEEEEGDTGGGLQEQLEGLTSEQKKAPIAVSGSNIYVAWWTNTTGNDEVMFRASANNGQTFSDKSNLSNSTDADSQEAQVSATEDGNVIVTWWEINQTSAEPVMRVSTDNGTTFEPIQMLGINGTISTRGLTQ